MKLIITTALALGAAFFAMHSCMAQPKNHSINSTKKEAMTANITQEVINKKVIHHLYEQVLNNRKLELLNDFISPDYAGAQGVKGVVGFKKSIQDLHTAFPDGQWTMETIVAEGNTVMVKQKLTGTHNGPFQQLAPTGKMFVSHGVGIYKFRDGKIIASQVETDRLGFLQQLGLLPQEVRKTSDVTFIDKFLVPKQSVKEFKTRMHYNRDFIATLSGYKAGDAYEETDATGNVTIITLAVWDSKESIDNAKIAVQAEFKRIGFNPIEFYERLGVTLERGLFSTLSE